MAIPISKYPRSRLLFVEDEKQLVDLYRAFFEKHGYEFLSTDDIDYAMRLTEEKKPEVILLDLLIPKKEGGMVKTDAELGYDFLAAVKKNPKTKDIPVVVFTSLDTIRDRERCAEMGAIKYLFKGKALPQDVLSAVATLT